MMINTASPDTNRLAQELARRLSEALGQVLTGFGDSTAEPPPLTIPPAAQAIAPALLARRHPGGPKAQRDARALYLRCLRHYREKVQRGLPEDDLGAAAAYFVLANLAALQSLDITEPQLALVERQMRHVIGRHDAWLAADARDRQSLFEQLAILGVLVGEGQAEARHQGDAALANVRRAARGYLVQLLGLNPDALRLTSEGLTLRAEVLMPELPAVDESQE